MIAGRGSIPHLGRSQVLHKRSYSKAGRWLGCGCLCLACPSGRLAASPKTAALRSVRRNAPLRGRRELRARWAQRCASSRFSRLAQYPLSNGQAVRTAVMRKVEPKGGTVPRISHFHDGLETALTRQCRSFACAIAHRAQHVEYRET